MAQFALDLFLGFGIGLSLGLMGGGGSLLTVPALVYLVGQTPQAAVTTSLAIVGANSLMGASFHPVPGRIAESVRRPSELPAGRCGRYTGWPG